MSTKRKSKATPSSKNKTKLNKKPQKTEKEEDELFTSVSDDESHVNWEVKEDGDNEKPSMRDEDEEEDEFAHETPDERRLRLAREYLKEIESKQDSEDDDDIEDPIAHRLRQDLQQQRPDYIRLVAEKYSNASLHVRLHRGHKLPLTSLVVSPDSKTCYTGSKDCCIIAWDIETGKRKFVYKGDRKRKDLPGHSDHVLALSLSPDGTVLASGSMDNTIRLWDTRSNQLLHVFKGHRGPVSCLSFNQATESSMSSRGFLLFSGSYDRTIKVWSAHREEDKRTYIDTLFGHQAEVHSMDSLYFERAVTCGADRTARVWKVASESQLVFRPPHSNLLQSLDCVALINEELFFVGDTEGRVSVYSANKKKPVCSMRETEAHAPEWVTSVAAFPFTDLLASGSSDGRVNLYRLKHEGSQYRLQILQRIPIVGFVNAMKFSSNGKYLICAVGQEHRLGRWKRIPEARNGIHIIDLSQTETITASQSSSSLSLSSTSSSSSQ